MMNCLAGGGAAASSRKLRHGRRWERSSNNLSHINSGKRRSRRGPFQICLPRQASERQAREKRSHTCPYDKQCLFWRLSPDVVGENPIPKQRCKLCTPGLIVTSRLVWRHGGSACGQMSAGAATGWKFGLPHNWPRRTQGASVVIGFLAGKWLPA